MKKYILLLVVICVAIFVSCDNNKETKSLVGTTWKAIENEDWIFVLEFTTTDVILTATLPWMETDSFRGIYTYDHPTVMVDMEVEPLLGNIGTVKGNVLEIEVFVSDVGSLIKFEKQ